MSVRVMSMVFDRYPAGGGEKLLALALADVSRDDGVMMINDSVPELARKTCQTDRGVQLQLRRMVAMGWLHVVKASDGGRHRCSTYRIDAGWLAGGDLVKAPTAETVNGVTSNGERGSPVHQPETVNGVTSNGERGSPVYRPTKPNTVIPPNPPLPLATGGELKSIEPKPNPKAKPKPSEAITLLQWLLRCKAEGVTPIPIDDPVYAYCGKVGISTEILALHWAEFKLRRGESSKRQADWRATFRNSVRSNWFRLWYIAPGQPAQLTTMGRQAEASHAVDGAVA